MATKNIPVQVISQQELIDMLQLITRSTVVSLTYVVDDTRSKTTHGKAAVQKKVHISHLYLNHDYEQKVQNLTGDITFQAQGLKGKTRVCGTLLQSDKTLEYLIDGKVLYTQASTLLAYYHDGVEITEEDAINLDLWRPSYYNPTSLPTAGRGLVSEDKDFFIVNTAISKICELKYGGILYKIQLKVE